MVKRCCGRRFLEDGHEINVITVNSSASFVAIGHFTQVVHTWLRSLEGELRAAKDGDSCWPFDSNVPRFVWPSPNLSALRGGSGQGDSDEIPPGLKWGELEQYAYLT